MSPEKPVRKLLEELLASGSVNSILRARYLPCRQLVAFEDFQQEVLLRALQYETRFRGRSLAELAGWLRTIAGNVMIDQLKRATLERSKRSSAEIPEQVTAPSEQAGFADLTDWIRQLVHTLPGEDQEIIYRRYRMRQRWPEIAIAMGINPNTLAQKHFRIIQRLRALQPPDL